MISNFCCLLNNLNCETSGLTLMLTRELFVITVFVG